MTVEKDIPMEFVNDYDAYAPVSIDENLADLAERRARCPMSYSTNYDGFWLATQYDDILQIIKRKEFFSNYPSSIIGEGSSGQVSKLIPIELDGSEHLAYRHLLNPLFTQTMAKMMEPDIRILANQLIDSFIDERRCEFVSQFAGPLPGTIFLRMMGWPLEDAPTFQRWADIALHGLPGATEDSNRAARVDAGIQMREYMTAIVEERRRTPTSDLTTILVNGQLGDGPIPEEELYDLILLLLMAGLDTVQSSLAQSFRFFAGDPAFRHGMLEPAAMPAAVEEMLRWTAPAQMTRTVIAPMEICGVQLQPGDRVHAPPAAANRDPKYYPSPDEPRLDRGAEVKPHLTFSAGAHRCLGSHIARLEVRAAFEEWHRRIPDYQITPGEPVVEHLSTVWGIDRLMLEW